MGGGPTARAVGASTSRPPTTSRPIMSERRKVRNRDKAVEDTTTRLGTHDSHALSNLGIP